MQLSSTHNGVVIDDDIKYNDGTVLSPSKGEMPEGQRGIPNITATTPRGGMYQFTLPDNTKIWLNNASDLKVSPKFWNATQRVVQLTGQAYFEVAKDAKRPFIVQSAGQNITVLGTHFDISAYPGEAIKTTLLEGSVRVTSLRGGTTTQPPLHNEQDGEAVTLKPNQQSIVTTSNKIEVKQVDVNEIIAWKNGYFRFYDVDLESFMTTIARWYNIEVNYEGGISQYKDLAFGGAVSRSKNISEVMKILEQTGKIHYKIEGRKVTITK
jgi:ferric-dicitrate binding protein FerR (iron transport regulator)